MTLAAKRTWWTCGCGSRECWVGAGTPECSACGKLAGFTVAAPAGQGGFDFGGTGGKG